jgi:proline iminopeptidase
MAKSKSLEAEIMKRKHWIILAGGALLALAAGGYAAYSAFTQPLYQIGMVHEGKSLRAPLDPPTQSGDPEYWQVEGDIQLWHFAQGSGRAVLIVHGGPGMPTRQAWTGLDPLAASYRFYYYDQRGCGKSTRPIDTFSSKNMYQNMTELDRTLGLGAQIADIERIRRILGEEKLIIVGHSWGGLLASLYAAEFPDRVEKLVLVSPATMLVMPQPQGEQDLFASVRAGLPEGERAGYDAFMKEYMDFNKLFESSEAGLVAKQEKFGEYYKNAIGDALPAQGAQGEPGGWMAWAMYASMGTRHDYRPALGKVSAPVLVIHGTDDLQTEAASRTYVEAFPNASFVAIPGAGHFSFEQQPEVFAKTVEEFFKQ